MSSPASAVVQGVTTESMDAECNVVVLTKNDATLILYALMDGATTIQWAKAKGGAKTVEDMSVDVGRAIAVMRTALSHV